MSTIEHIKNGIKMLYDTDTNVHISVKMTRPKVIIEGRLAKIVGIYANIFQIEENEHSSRRRYTIQYVDVLTGQVVIDELNYVPTANTLNKK